MPRLLEILRQGNNYYPELSFRILGADSAAIVAHGKASPYLSLGSHVAVPNTANAEVYLESKLNIEPLLLRTAFIASLALLLAAVFYWLVRRLPFQRYVNIFHALEQTKSILSREVEMKQQALNQAKEYGEAMNHMALHDHLTDLPNRMLFRDRLEHAIEHAIRSNERLAVLFLDLDGFKQVNDTLGHQAGDTLLQKVSQRLQRGLRECDTVARLGGDEFSVLITPADKSRAILVAQHIHDILSPPYKIDGQQINIGTSVGIALYPEHSFDSVKLMVHADVAMYHAKRNRLDHSVYDSVHHAKEIKLYNYLNELPQAIKAGQLQLHFQPKIDLIKRHVYGAEALIRWQHPTLGFISPVEFIPLAEQTQHIHELTQWAIDSTFQSMKAWKARGFDIQMSINIAAPSLTDELPRTIKAAFEKWNIDPARITLEITETAMLLDPNLASAVLSKLSRLGVGLSVDDFGTGYSSFTYLKKFPISEIKIDQSFVTDICRSPDDGIIAKSILDIGQNLALNVVAEGIEDAEACKRLIKMGCRYGQGFYFSPALAADDFYEWCKNSSWNAAKIKRAKAVRKQKSSTVQPTEDRQQESVV